MAKYIDADKVTKLIKNYGKGAISDGQKTLDPVDDIVMLAKGVELIPTADVVEVRHGEWLQTQEPLGWCDVDCVECSVCKESWIINDDLDIDDYKIGWHFCPNCGAKMDGKDEGE